MTRTVLTYGTFDLFHIGHLHILTRLSLMGDSLIVGVTSDDFNLHRNKKTCFRYEDRAAIVAGLRCVDQVFPMKMGNQKVDDIKRFQVTLFGMGDDWLGHFDNLRKYCEVIYLPRTEGVSSTVLRRQLPTW